ncbi:MAG: universal stress protein [Bacteroidia bacterium]
MSTENRVLRTILVPTDFSEVAHQAYIYALHFAEQFQTSIVLLHVYQDISVAQGVAPEGFVESLRAARVHEAATRFDRYQQEVQQEIDHEIEVSSLIRAGTPVDQILSVAQEHEVGMIIMGTMGAESMAEKILGSVTTRVIDLAACPVLAIPFQMVYEPIQHILYATNFEEDDLQVIDQLLDYAAVFGARVSCVHIQTQGSQWNRLDRSVFEKVYQLERDQESVTFYTLNENDIVAGLQRFVAANRVDLMAMLCHQRSMMNRLYHESLTREMTLHTSVPLLAFHF